MAKMAERSMRRKSGVWKHFVIDMVNITKATCLHSQESISREGKTSKSFNTSNLRKHFTSGHSDEHASLVEEESMAQGQPTISICSDWKEDPLSLWSSQSYRQLARLIGELIAVDKETFNIISLFHLTNTSQKKGQKNHLCSCGSCLCILLASIKPGVFVETASEMPLHATRHIFSSILAFLQAYMQMLIIHTQLYWWVNDILSVATILKSRHPYM